MYDSSFWMRLAADSASFADIASTRRSIIKPIRTHNLARVGPERSGFTLLELLVAMLIMSLIVLASAMMYHSGSTAYQRGMERADITLVGRSLVQMIAAELSMAVTSGPEDYVIEGETPKSGPASPFAFMIGPPGPNGNTIDFARFAPSDEGEITSPRGLMRVSYQAVPQPPPPGGAAPAQVVERTVTTFDSVNYGGTKTPNSVPLADRILRLEFRPDPDWPPPPAGHTNLPEYVDIFVDTLTEEDWLRNQPQNLRTYHRRVYLANRDRYR